MSNSKIYILSNNYLKTLKTLIAEIVELSENNDSGTKLIKTILKSKTFQPW